MAAHSDGVLPPPTVPPTVLLDEIEAAELEGNDDRIEGVLCGAAKQLKVTRAKPDSILYLSLMYLAKIKPNIFATEGVIEVRPGRPLTSSWEGVGRGGWPSSLCLFSLPGGLPGSTSALCMGLGFPWPCALSCRLCAASCGGTPPSTSRPRGTASCPFWLVTC